MPPQDGTGRRIANGGDLMKPSARIPGTPTEKALVDSLETRGIPRRQFLRRAALVGMGAATAGGLFEATISHPAAAQTRSELVSTAADTNVSLANRITAIGRVLSGQDRRLGSVLQPVTPPELPPEAQTALRDALAVVASLATRMQPILGISAPPSDWTGGTIPPPPTDD